MRISGLALVCAIAVPIAQQSFAQRLPADPYPSRPVSVVIPFVAGGTTDNEARLYTQKLQESTGQPFVFDFRPGGATTIGTAHVAKALPDGYTILINNNGVTINPHFYPDLPYDIIKSFAPITIMSERSTAMLSSPAGLSGVHNLPDLVAYAKANPGKINCGTSGAGSLTHIVCASLASATGTKITFVHYKGVAQGVVDLIAGRTHIAAGTLFTAQPNIKSGKLRAIAILGEQRARLFPEIKTAIEQGADVTYPSWLGVLAPSGTAPAIVARLHAEFVKAVRFPDVVKQLEVQGSVPVANSPDVFRARIVAELARWKRIIQDEGIRLEE